MKNFTFFIVILLGIIPLTYAQVEPRAYLIDNVSRQFSALGTVSDDIFFIAPSPVTSGENAGAIDPNNLSTGYVLDDSGNFYQIEIQTGTYTFLGNMLSDWRGMEFDEATGILYAITGADLYIIDPAVVTATLVGSLGFNDGEYPIALGIDSGVGYIIESHKENSYSVDLNTGTATLLGALRPNDSDSDRIGDIGGMDGLTVIYIENDHYRLTFKSNLNPTNGELDQGVYIDGVSSYNQEHGWFSYGELYPDLSSCKQPILVYGSPYSGTEISYFWLNYEEEDAVNGYNWEIYSNGEDPDTSSPLQAGHTPQYETSVIVGGLLNEFVYDFYVVRDCGANGTSKRSTRTKVQTWYEPPLCGVRDFYDNGGGNEGYYNKMYNGHEWRIRPQNEGEGIEITFVDFDLQDGHDALYIYDGPNWFFPLIDSGQPETETGFPAGGYTGSVSPGTITSTHKSGRLTFVLYSDNEYTDNAGWHATVSCFQLRPPNDLIENVYDIDELDGFPYRDDNQLLQYATEETTNPSGCSIYNKKGVWYKFTAEENATVTAEVVSPGGDTYVSFYSAPNENATETDLTFVDQPTNYCDQTSVSSINVEEGQVYYVYVVNTEGESDVFMSSTPLMGVSDNAIEGFTYHPNPTTGKLSFKGKDKIDTVVIFNLSGQKIWQETVNATSGQIDLSKFPAGVYLMQVETNGQRGAYKIIKK